MRIPQEFHPQITYRFPDANIKETVIVGRDSAGLEIHAGYLEYLDYPVTEWIFYFTNRNTQAQENSFTV